MKKLINANYRNQWNLLCLFFIKHQILILLAPYFTSFISSTSRKYITELAHQPFVYNLKSAVKFYDENVTTGLPVQGIVSPAEQAGLRFDQNSFSIVGTPTRTGTYLFKSVVVHQD